ncbi:hypothetical protein H257_18552, partial [Aphanomyces astaci]
MLSVLLGTTSTYGSERCNHSFVGQNTCQLTTRKRPRRCSLAFWGVAASALVAGVVVFVTSKDVTSTTVSVQVVEFAAATIVVPVKCTPVSVQGDATYCITGKTCGADAGTVCPMKGATTSQDCFPGIRSYVNATACIAPLDSACSWMANGGKGCVFKFPTTAKPTTAKPTTTTKGTTVPATSSAQATSVTSGAPTTLTPTTTTPTSKPPSNPASPATTSATTSTQALPSVTTAAPTTLTPTTSTATSKPSPDPASQATTSATTSTQSPPSIASAAPTTLTPTTTTATSKPPSNPASPAT